MVENGGEFVAPVPHLSWRLACKVDGLLNFLSVVHGTSCRGLSPSPLVDLLVCLERSTLNWCSQIADIAYFRCSPRHLSGVLGCLAFVVRPTAVSSNVVHHACLLSLSQSPY